MALRAVYERFLQSPNPLSLSDAAVLHYIPTLTTFSQSGPVIRHLEGQNKNVVNTKAEKVIGIVEGHDSIAVEIETTLEFLSGGGAYLPGLENFVVDKIATLPLTHIVHFDSNQKISQIRLSWDQGSLLAQVDVIGSRGKNWPITDGKEQIRLISSHTTAASSKYISSPERGRDLHGENKDGGVRNPSPGKKRIHDPHASLNLFEPKPTEESRFESNAVPIPPRVSAKPPQRDMSDLFVAGHEDYEPRPEHGGSPKKSSGFTAIAPKGAGSQKFLPSRLFQDEDDTKSPAGYKSDPSKYNHFDLGEDVESDPLQHQKGSKTQGGAAVPMRAKTDKHMSQWDFEDFNTPAKVKQKFRSQDVVQFSYEDNNDAAEPPHKAGGHAKPRSGAEAQFEFRDDGTPVDRKPAVPKARKDSEHHFEFRDEATPAAQRTTARPKSTLSTNNPSNFRNNLYRNNLYDEGAEDSEDVPDKAALTTITNNVGRKKDFGGHWNMGQATPPNEKMKNENKPVGNGRTQAVNNTDEQMDGNDQSAEGRQKPLGGHQARKGMQSHWTLGHDESPASTKNGRRAEKGIWDF